MLVRIVPFPSFIAAPGVLGSIEATSILTRGDRYNALGNITHHSDVGNYSYVPPAGSAGPTRPHAVRSITGQAGKLTNPVYLYDLHGNIQKVTGANGVVRNHAWTSFDMPQSLGLTQDNVSSTFLYGPEHQRVRQTIVRSGQTRTVQYLHPDNEGTLYFERELPGTGGVATNRHFLSAEKGAYLQIEAPGAIPADPVAANLTGLQMRYWHKDHLGSVVAVTDGAGAVMERLAYEPFGKRRRASGKHDKLGAIDAATTKRGFTGHEHLDEVDYIHMNGRIYDPDIARFLSPDPTVPYFHHLQSFNRYSYTRNNPLNRIDPNGFDDGESGESSDGTESLGNSLSKESVAKGTGKAADGNATSPTNPSNNDGTKPQAGEESEKPPSQARLNKIHGIGVDVSKFGEMAVKESAMFGLWGLPASLFGRAVAATRWAVSKFGIKTAEKVAEKTVQAAVNETRVVPQLERVEIVGKRAKAQKVIGETLPDSVFSKKAPKQVTPGTATVRGQYINDKNRVESWKAHYDSYGRQIGRTDYNAGNKAQGIPDTHSHSFEYGPGKNGMEVKSHVPGEYKP